MEATGYLMILAAVTFTLRGLHQGQVMVKVEDPMHRDLHDWFYFDVPTQAWQDGVYKLMEQFNLGPRGHRWFSHYHLIDGTKDALLIVIGLMLAHTTSWETVALCAAVAWLVFEPSYTYGRYGKLITDTPENVLGLGIHVNAKVMTAVRIGIIAGLIWRVL